MLEKKLEEIEHEIVHGSGARARALLKSINTKKIPRAKASSVGELSRRALLPLLSIKILFPIVSPASKVKPSSDEILEYAFALSEIGAHHEAKRLLQGLDQYGCSFALAYVHIRLWEFEKGREYFKLFLKNSEGHREVSIHRSRVEMARCFIDTGKNIDEAIEEIEKVLKGVGPKNFRVIYKHALYCLSQALIIKGEVRKARPHLQQLKELATEDKEDSWLNLSHEWILLANIREKLEVSESIKKLVEIKYNAPQLKQWETVRRIDLYRALFTNDTELLKRLYFGSPYPKLKERIAGILKEIPEQFEWILYPTSPNGQPVLRKQVAVYSLYKEGSLPQRLLNALVADLYRPLNVPVLHDFLYPGEFYNPLSSPGRIHQAVKRLNEQLQEDNALIQVIEDKGFYYLSPIGQRPVTLILKDVSFKMEAPVEQRLAGHVAKLKDSFSHEEFSASDAATALDISYRSTIRYLNIAVEQSLIQKIRSGLNIVYKIS